MIERDVKGIGLSFGPGVEDDHLFEIASLQDIPQVGTGSDLTVIQFGRITGQLNSGADVFSPGSFFGHFFLSVNFDLGKICVPKGEPHLIRAALDLQKVFRADL